MKPMLRDLLRPALAQFVTDEGVWADSSVWIVTARAADRRLASIAPESD